jgi:hypothetical protein
MHLAVPDCGFAGDTGSMILISGSLISHGNAIDIPLRKIYQITGLYDNPVRLQ